jgi:dCTP deaminase
MITPFSEDQLQPASYDVRLMNIFMGVSKHHLKTVNPLDPSTYETLYNRVELPENEPYILPPGGCVLGCTQEIVTIPGDIVCRIEGRSSIGRLFLIVHATAGFVDPGFHGRLTLEIYNLLPVPFQLWPGMSIAQLSFMYTCDTPDRTYDGRYQGDYEPTKSRYVR